VAAESLTNLRGSVRLFDDIVEVEEHSTHDVEFRIDQFKHSTHDSLRRVACEQRPAQSKPAPHSCSMLEDDFRSVREITVTIAVSFRCARAKPPWPEGSTFGGCRLMGRSGRALAVLPCFRTARATAGRSRLPGDRLPRRGGGQGSNHAGHPFRGGRDDVRPALDAGQDDHRRPCRAWLRR
jgi:hypothetical protein